MLGLLSPQRSQIPSLVRTLDSNPIIGRVLHRSSRYITDVLPGAVSLSPHVRRALSRAVINSYSYAAVPRPRALSMSADYTSWRSLMDRSYSGRHLPPIDASLTTTLPSEADVVALFRRGREIKSANTSVAFVFFAQWFTDAFLRTDRKDIRRNTSNHEVDLCQIYGLTHAKTLMLRSGQGGRLKSQIINGEEFPAFLFQPRRPGAPLVVKEEFKDLHNEDFLTNVILAEVPDDRKESIFAVGLEHGNATIGYAMLNTVFLREHNRIAGVLAGEHSDWDDDRLFETTRNILIVLLIKIVVEEYVKHIAPFDVPIEMVPFVADGERWNRSNWISIEFNILYRWHSLVPDAIGESADKLQPGDFRNNNSLVIERGIEALLTQCSKAKSGKIGLMNTPYFLVDRHMPDQPSIEERTVSMMRAARLRSYNDYREAFGLKRLKNFKELTKNAVLRERLQGLYGGIDHVEWYVGIFAEDYPDYMVMGELMTTMVAYDAFTQALTNPLLGRNVFNENTFTKAGMKIIEETTSLQQIVTRSSKSLENVRVSFTV